MKYRYLEKTYCFGSYGPAPGKPGDRWYLEGVVRFVPAAIMRELEKNPEQFAWGEISVAEYERELQEHFPEDNWEDGWNDDWNDTWDDDWEEAWDHEFCDAWDEEACVAEDMTGPVIVVEYGPDDWRIIHGWAGMTRARELGQETLPAVWLGSEQAMRYLVDEEDVRMYIRHWNFKAAWWERHDRIQGYLRKDSPEFVQVHADAEATWQAILEAACDREIEVPVRWNRWFSIRGDGHRVWIGEASHMIPSCALTLERQVRRRDFMELFPMYEEWEMAAHEEEIRERARRVTISYEYIFSMIRQYAAEPKCGILAAKSI